MKMNAIGLTGVSWMGGWYKPSPSLGKAVSVRQIDWIKLI